MVNQVSGSVRVVFWNTWLLRPRLWPGGPAVPGSDRIFAPDVVARAPRVGEALAGRFDVCALSEVFHARERDAVASAWEEAEFQPGPGTGRFRVTGSGLVTVVDPTNVAVVATADHVYRAGGDLRDSDTYATKGALLTRVRLKPEGPELDVVSTHLLSGGELLPVPGANDQGRHHRARMAQVDELLAFIGREHDPANTLLVVGDFNVAAHDPDPSLDDPSTRYRDLADRLGAIGLADLWATHGVGPGPTCSFTDAAQLPPDPVFPDAVADRADGPDDPAAASRAYPAGGAGQRIDYLWLAVPDDGSVRVEADQPRRWAFPGRGVRGGRAGSLSDHLALSVSLHLSVPAA